MHVTGGYTIAIFLAVVCCLVLLWLRTRHHSSREAQQEQRELATAAKTSLETYASHARLVGSDSARDTWQRAARLTKASLTVVSLATPRQCSAPQVEETQLEDDVLNTAVSSAIYDPLEARRG